MARSMATRLPGIAALSPEVVVVSAGQGNSYGHPDPAALRLYAESGATVYRTDVNGTVVIEANRPARTPFASSAGRARVRRRSRATGPEPAPAPSEHGPATPSVMHRHQYRQRHRFAADRSHRSRSSAGDHRVGPGAAVPFRERPQSCHWASALRDCGRSSQRAKPALVSSGMGSRCRPSLRQPEHQIRRSRSLINASSFSSIRASWSSIRVVGSFAFAGSR